MIITWGSAREKQCVGRDRDQDLSNYQQKRLKEMWKLIKNLRKLFFFFVFVPENGKFCPKFILSGFLFVVGVAIALEQPAEVKGAAAVSPRRCGSLGPAEPLPLAGTSWQEVLEGRGGKRLL